MSAASTAAFIAVSPLRTAIPIWVFASNSAPNHNVGARHLVHQLDGARRGIEQGVGAPLPQRQRRILRSGQRHHGDACEPAIAAPLVVLPRVAFLNATERDGDRLPAQGIVAAGDLRGIGRLHDNQAADLQIGDELYLFRALRIDVHGRVDEIDARALKRGDQTLELHVHRLRLGSELFAQCTDHVDVETRQLAVLLIFERREGGGNAVCKRSFFDQSGGREIRGQNLPRKQGRTEQAERQHSADNPQA